MRPAQGTPFSVEIGDVIRRDGILLPLELAGTARAGDALLRHGGVVADAAAGPDGDFRWEASAPLVDAEMVDVYAMGALAVAVALAVGMEQLGCTAEEIAAGKIAVDAFGRQLAKRAAERAAALDAAGGEGAGEPTT